CKVLVLSALSQDTFVTKAMHLGADYFMRTPANPDTVKKRITELMQAPAAEEKAEEKTAKPARVKNRSLEEKITNIFITVGIPAHIKGYQFLREAIKLAIDNPDIINSITKKLYPEVAERFDTSPSKVERAIRHAIEVAWNRGKIENINSLFGVRVYNHNEKPTNGEFIALVADKMLLESV
ncbi:MAG: sporulation transcription factor Spo0A, partial [Clostridiales bacterium]|nr:sporulation transcription factor Spo0A [Clostridiales bacterium]